MTTEIQATNASESTEVDVSYQYINDTDYQDNGQVFVTIEIGEFSATATFCTNENGDFHAEIGWEGDVEAIEDETGEEILDLIDYDEIHTENSKGFLAYRTKIWDNLKKRHKDDFKSDANFGCGCHFNSSSFEIIGDGFIRLIYKNSSDTLHYIDEDGHDALLKIEEDFDYNDANRVLKVHALFTNNGV